MSNLTGENPYAAPLPTDDWTPKPLPPTGRVLAQAWQVCTNHWITIAAVAAIFWGPTELLSSFLVYEASVADELLVLVLVISLEWVVYPLGTAAVIAVAIDAASGTRVSARAAVATSLRRFWIFFVTYSLSSFVTGIAAVLLIVPGVYLMIKLSLVDSVVVNEGKWGLSAMSRSFELTSHRFWPLFGLVLLFVLMASSPLILFEVTTVLLPAADMWLVDAAVSFITDLVGAYGVVCLYLVYRQLSGGRMQPPSALQG